VKVANGSAASIAEPSNQAIKDATNMLNTAKASEDITATIKAINDDISVVEHNNKRMLEGTLNKIRNIGKGPGTPPRLRRPRRHLRRPRREAELTTHRRRTPVDRCRLARRAPACG
jgi:hypothetical protein